MIEQALIEYMVNALWQVPLLAGAAWLLLRMVKPEPTIQHGVWLAVLGLAVLLPVHGMGKTAGLEMRLARVRAQQPAQWREEPPLRENDRPPAEAPWFVFLPQIHNLRMAPVTAHWLVRLYLAAMGLAMFRIARSWLAARHLVMHSRETTLCERDRSAWEADAQRLGVTLPQLRESGEVAGPVIVGVVAPILLLPEGFARHTADEVRAALCHELAHIKRQDYLVNMVCQLAALPVVWHPMVYGIQQCIRATREMVCDAIAAREMKSEIRYAKCLLALAQSMLGGDGMTKQAQSLGLFSSNVLEERVMRLMETRTMSVRSRAIRVASGAAVMIATTSIAAMFHVNPTMAQSNTAAPLEAAQTAPASSQIQPQDTLPSVSLPAVTLDQNRDRDQNQNQQPASAQPRRTEKKAPMDRAQRRAVDAKSAERQQQIADAQKRASEAIAKLNSPEFKQQMADAQKRAAEAIAKFNSPEFRQQMADAQKKASEAMAKFNSPEFRQQMADAQKRASEAIAKLNSPEFKQQIEDAQKQASEAIAKFDSPEFRQQMADAQKRASEAAAAVNSPEFKREMEDLQKQLQNGELQRWAK
jgi:beta-lactamase regulating signal transducer with metallopeptidase domain